MIIKIEIRQEEDLKGARVEGGKERDGDLEGEATQIVGRLTGRDHRIPIF